MIPKEDVNIIKIFQSPINNNEIKKLYNQLANHTTGKAKIESKGSRRIATVGVTIPGTRLWSNNTVNVSVSPDFSNEQKNNILTAIDIWHTNTSLNFNIVDVNDGTVQKVNIIPTASGCRSTTGMPSIHDGTIQLSPTCDIQSIIHEIGHTVGLIHEHQRPLRDTYLKNVLNEQDLSVIASAFSESLANSIRYNLEIEEVIDDLDPFDMHSVMLYGSWPRNNQELSDYLKYQYQKPFYTDANGQEVVRPTYGLTPNDIKKVHRIYGMAD
ncbi:Astacin (Peptidase family M12A) [Chryseobacterium sp. RU37D]|uniref:M12 family metallopeptidase n=1 Tax=Chryseobacterium sp. RU37D TaxID=1907397 RepID=UPI000953DBA5|nr:M12 family metallopeptidase [Chryseobacterium sp. RU37D]SIQ18345.1 Astacin (Peptidase family M12A) [Chryseobacterium sp. RU37D]